MKKLKFLVVILIMASSVYAQNNLLVIKVSGSIVAKTINKELKPGLEVSSNESFSFKTPTSTASFIEPKSGKISQLNSTRSIIMPDIDVFEDRGEVNESLFTYFSDTVVFMQKIAVALPQNLYERFSNQDYILSIIINSQKKTISFNQTENIFILEKDSTQNLASGVYEAQLCSVKKNDKSNTILSEFCLLIPDTHELLDECSLIKKNTPNSENITKNLVQFIRLNYGKISESDLNFIVNSQVEQ
jgi:hypothetical protein